MCVPPAYLPFMGILISTNKDMLHLNAKAQKLQKCTDPSEHSNVSFSISVVSDCGLFAIRENHNLPSMDVFVWWF